MDMREPRVFVVQETQRWDRASRAMVPKFDVEPARVFGNIRFLLGPKARPFNISSVLPELRVKLKEFTSHDFLLLIGNPVLIGVVTALVAQHTNGRFRVLQWSGVDQRYINIDILL